LLLAWLTPLLATVACGSNEGISQEDPRYGPIAAVIAGAVETYASQGAFGLHVNMTPQVREKCTAEEFAATMGQRSDVGPLLGIEKVTVDGETAVASIRLGTASGEKEVDWRLEQRVNGRWAVLEVPGSEPCTP
jgi:hypothetical protein